MSRHLSPGGQLLRSSRLFAIPPPLPRPVTEIPMRGRSDRFSDSNTATLPYPIRQAIATPHSSLNQGDWGLKRALPIAETTKTSDPTVRIIELDSFEHITDYEPASDHVKTLEKFQELGIPVRKGLIRTSLTQESTGAFEKQLDNTARVRKDALGKPVQKFSTTRDDQRRWKYRGPNLSAMSSGDFENFMTSKVLPGKSKFSEEFTASLVNKWLRTMVKKVETALKADSREAAHEDLEAPGQLWLRGKFHTWLLSLDEGALAALAHRTFDEERTLREKVKTIRNHLRQSAGYSQSSDLQSSKLIPEDSLPNFEDYVRSCLASEGVSSATPSSEAGSDVFARAVQLVDDFQKQFSEGQQPYLDAMLSGLRARFTKEGIESSLSNHIIEHFDMPKPAVSRLSKHPHTETIVDRSLSTHPSLGLSYLRTQSILDNHPIQGPLEKRSPYEARVLKGRSGGNQRAYLGVAGFVADEPTGMSHLVTKLDINSPGGHKHWVVPTSAVVQSDGRVHVQLDNAGLESQSIRKGEFYEQSTRSVVSPRSNPAAPLDKFDEEPVRGEPSAALKNMNHTVSDLQKRFPSTNKAYPSR